MVGRLVHSRDQTLAELAGYRAFQEAPIVAGHDTAFEIEDQIPGEARHAVQRSQKFASCPACPLGGQRLTDRRVLGPGADFAGDLGQPVVDGPGSGLMHRLQRVPDISADALRDAVAQPPGQHEHRRTGSRGRGEEWPRRPESLTERSPLALGDRPVA